MAYTATLTGDGEVDLSGIADVPEYAIVHVITAGPMVRTPFDLSPDLVVKVGWFQFGAEVDLGFGARSYWNDPIWINGLYWIWSMPQGQHRSAPRLRYWLSPGTEIYMLIGP